MLALKFSRHHALLKCKHQDSRDQSGLDSAKVNPLQNINPKKRLTVKREQPADRKHPVAPSRLKIHIETQKHLMPNYDIDDVES